MSENKMDALVQKITSREAPPHLTDWAAESFADGWNAAVDQHRAALQPQPEPVAFIYGTGLLWPDELTDFDKAEATPLYAAPPTPAADVAPERVKLPKDWRVMPAEFGYRLVKIGKHGGAEWTAAIARDTGLVDMTAMVMFLDDLLATPAAPAEPAAGDKEKWLAEVIHNRDETISRLQGHIQSMMRDADEVQSSIRALFEGKAKRIGMTVDLHGTLKDLLHTKAEELTTLRAQLAASEARVETALVAARERYAALLESQKYMTLEPLRTYTADEVCQTVRESVRHLAGMIRNSALSPVASHDAAPTTGAGG